MKVDKWITEYRIQRLNGSPGGSCGTVAQGPCVARCGCPASASQKCSEPQILSRPHSSVVAVLAAHNKLLARH
eukprot:3592363-Pyramimonas_sp.AAC.2